MNYACYCRDVKMDCIYINLIVVLLLTQVKLIKSLILKNVIMHSKLSGAELLVFLHKDMNT